MITWITSAAINQGKLEEGFQWAVKVANHLNKNIPGHHIQVMRNVEGQRYQVHWIASADSLAAYEEVTKAIEADAGYRELVAEQRQEQLLVASSLIDTLYASIP